MRILLALLFLVAAGGCSNDTVKKVKEIADRACACPDATCAGEVEKEFWAFAKEQGTKRGTKDDRDEVQASYNRMRECLVKARSAVPPAPAAPGSSAASAGGAAGTGG